MGEVMLDILEQRNGEFVKVAEIPLDDVFQIGISRFWTLLNLQNRTVRLRDTWEVAPAQEVKDNG